MTLTLLNNSLKRSSHRSPPILALKATPTLQSWLFAVAATSPAHRVPCLNKATKGEMIFEDFNRSLCWLEKERAINYEQMMHRLAPFPIFSCCREAGRAKPAARMINEASPWLKLANFLALPSSPTVRQIGQLGGLSREAVRAQEF